MYKNKTLHVNNWNFILFSPLLIAWVKLGQVVRVNVCVCVFECVCVYVKE